MNKDKDMKNIDATSKDLIEHNLEQLKQIFPSAFTEGKIDFDALKSELGEHIEKNDERYQFTWAGKEQAKRIATTPSLGTLRPAPEESLNWDDTENLYIEGDNLEVLKLLQKSYFGKVKIIYIDPPYNTGKDFVYKDDFKDNLANYKRLTNQIDDEGNPLRTNSDSAGRFHSNWLNMMYPRLKLARNLLKDDGVIFISIDDNEVHNLRKICDEIFGLDNFLAELIWHLTSGPQAGHFTRSNEYILCFAKNKFSLEFFTNNSGGTIKHGALKKISAVNPPSEVFFKKGTIQIDGDDAIFEGEIGGSEKQYIKKGRLCFKNGVLDEDVVIEAGWAMKNQLLNWLDGKETFDSKGQKVIRFYFNQNGILFYEKERGTVHPKTVFSSTDYGSTKTGGDILTNLLGAKYFDFPKPNDLIKKFVDLATNTEEIVLDFFSGSATTAHAVMQLNSEDNGNRKYIMVQIPEPTPENSEARKASYKNIAEIGKERIRRAAVKIKEEHPDTKADLGFKVLKLDTSNIKKWQPDLDNLEQDIFDAAENIMPNRSSEDLLYEVLLKYGLPLTLPVETLDLDGYTIFNVASGSLIACFDENVNLNTIQSIINLGSDETPILRVVFLDNSFTDSTIKTNAIQRLKQAGIEDVLSI